MRPSTETQTARRETKVCAGRVDVLYQARTSSWWAEYMLVEMGSKNRGNIAEQSWMQPVESSLSGEILRNVIFISPSEPEPLINFLREMGWEVDFCRKLSDGVKLMDSGNYAAGMLDMEILMNQNFQQWDDLCFNNRQCQWIGLIDHKLLVDDQIRYLIARDFFDFQTKPIKVSQLLPVLGHACGMSSLRKDFSTNFSEVAYADIIGNSHKIRQLIHDIRKLESVDAPVLILGESGTGKELVARAIHRYSRQEDGPFIAVNCGAIPETLIQSELYGHEKGSFTGAHARKIGKIEAARHGTIFLDEIGDLLLGAQTHLLRFLQEKTIERVGGCDPIRSNARVIAATHVDLESAVEKGLFRHDLYHRLDVLRLTVPPLRDRGSDIELLAHHFYKRFQAEKRPDITGFSQEAIQAMYHYHWPGNVRELMNRIRHAVVMSENRLISAADLRLESPLECLTQEPRLTLVKESAERQALERMLENDGLSISEVALRMGISRATLYRLLGKYDLRRRHRAN